MNVTLPDGTTLTDIPEGTTQSQIREKLAANGYDVAKLDVPTASPGADYSNEGRMHPAPEVQPDPLATVKNAVAQAVPGGKDIRTGVLKSLVDNAAQTLPNLPGVKMLQILGKSKGIDPVADAQKYTSDEYKQAGMGAGVGKVIGDAAISGPAANAVGDVARNVVGRFAPDLLARAISVPVSGAAGGALLPPGEGETRAGNALQGAATATVLGGGTKLAGEGINKLRSMSREGPMDRAYNMFEKDLGKGKMDSVRSNLDNPQTLPMSTAAAAGSDDLAAFEKTSRAERARGEGGKWARLDQRTKDTAWEQTAGALDDSASMLEPRWLEKQMAFKPFQDKLNTVRPKPAQMEALGNELDGLRNSPNFQGNNSGNLELNKLIAEVNSPGISLGALANIDTRIGTDVYRFEPIQAQEVRSIVRQKIDDLSGGLLTKAHNELASTRVPLENSEAAVNILRANQSDFGGAKGRTTSGYPELTSTKLQGQINRFGETVEKDAPFPRSLLDDTDRQQLQDVVDSLRRSEHPTRATVPAKEMPGAAAPDVPQPSTRGVTRWLAEKFLGSRDEATRRAAGIALRSPQGWRKMVDTAEANKEISARDAAFLAGILRTVGPVSGALSKTED